MTATRVWNFVLTGEVRSGAAAVAGGVTGRPDAVCHVDLFHPAAEARRVAHEAYFGPPAAADVDHARTPEWYADGQTSPWQYLNHVVFPAARRNETAVGVHVPFPVVRRLELYDLFAAKYRTGNFSMIHVVRNPIACFVSWQQAEQSAVWTRGWAVDAPRLPRAVTVTAADLTAFCLQHAATAAKVRAACKDVLDVPYRDLVEQYQDTMAAVFTFLELPANGQAARTPYRRLRNRPMVDRVANWAAVRAEVPTAVRRLMDADDLF